MHGQVRGVMFWVADWMFCISKPRNLGFFPSTTALFWVLECGQKHMLDLLKGFGTL